MQRLRSVAGYLTAADIAEDVREVNRLAVGHFLKDHADYVRINELSDVLDAKLDKLDIDLNPIGYGILRTPLYYIARYGSLFMSAEALSNFFNTELAKAQAASAGITTQEAGIACLVAAGFLGFCDHVFKRARKSDAQKLKDLIYQSQALNPSTIE